MTTIAKGSNATITVADGGKVTLASNGGLYTVTETPLIGPAKTTNHGPTSHTRVFGPYVGGASVVVTNQTVDTLNYVDYEVGTPAASTVAVGATTPFTLSDMGTAAVATNGGLWWSTITPSVGNPVTRMHGPGPVRFQFGPYPVGATLSITNQTVNSLSAVVTTAVPAGPQLPQQAAMVARFSADSITPQTDGSNVTSWTDSVSAIAFTQATSANQPKYKVARLGGKPSVQLQGSQWLFGAHPVMKAAIDSGNCTVIMVVSNPVVNGNGMVFGNSANSGINTFAFQVTGNVVGRFDNTNTRTGVPWTASSMMTFGISSSSTPVYVPQSGTGNEILYARGMAVGRQSNAVTPPTSSATGNFAIGARDDSGALTTKCDVYEILVWNRMLTDVEWLQAEAWICNKYSQPLPWAGLTSLDIHAGDSLTVGVMPTNDVSKSAPYLTETSRGRTFGQWAMHACGGTTWGGMKNRINDWIAMGAYLGIPINVVGWEWYNEKAGGGFSPAQAWQHCQDWISAVRTANSPGIKIGIMSSTAYSGDAADPYATVRGAYNTLLDTNVAALVDQYQPIHSDATAGPLIGNSTAYANNGATYGYGDGIHLNAAGYAVLAPVATACLNAMRA